jgi:flavin reductase (DIM6/NTAB) family NADH-FMN oxidoreductase RutF
MTTGPSVPMLDAADFRAALARFASGVTVLTTRTGDGVDLGMTATAFSSLSLTPPLVLTCVDNEATMAAQLPVGAPLAVHVLAEAQAAWSARFAGTEGDRFAGLPVTRGLGDLPLLPDALARLECRVTARHPGGDHVIVVAAVERVTLGEAAPLLYFRGAYARLAP